ncbi:TonB-dependent receptor [Maricaulis parjimensis]|uniref:TonB-dependent receptor n=1 Tax=Maricaulis parjimensis TaxID=144023 RepID=UPI001939CB0E|nr:TonB-dependent receptor [Maricaulis parjimensis]
MASTSMLALTSPTFAQDENAPSVDEDVIIVTANKREEPIQTVAATVNVVSNETISDLRVTTVQELTTVVGGLSLTMTSPSEQSVSLRGIKMPSAGGSGGTTNTVESYINQVPISSVDLFSATLDIGQVEILKGPQGTLQGRPSPSGALIVTTMRPSFDEANGFIEGTLTDHDGRNIQAAYGGPIGDNFAFRLAGVYDYNGGTEVQNIANGNSNYAEIYVTRGSLSWMPNDRLQIDAMLQYTHDERDFYRQVTGAPPCTAADRPAGYANPIDYPVSSVGCGQEITLFDRIAMTDGDNLNVYEGTLFTLNASFEINDILELVYVGGYNDNTYDNRLDFDFAGIGAANQIPTFLTASNENTTFSNELRLHGSPNDFYNFIFGVFTAHRETSGTLDFVPFAFGIPSGSETDDFGIFTNQRFQLTDDDSLELGVRYTQIDVENTISSVETSYHAITGNANYRHFFTPDVMGYVNFGTSYRPGSAGTRGSPVDGVIPASYGNFDDEHSQSLEYGLKTQWFDNRLTANIAIFDQAYDGYIASQFNIACTGVPSAPGTGTQWGTRDGTPTGDGCFGTMFGNGDAVSKGYEIELSFDITDNWTINTIYTYTDAHFDNALVPCNDYDGDGVLDTNGPPMVQEGRYVSECAVNGPLGALPSRSWSANTNYDFQVGGLDAYVRASAVGYDSYFFPQTGRTFEGDLRVNAYVGIRDQDRNWELMLWAKNLFDHVVEDTDGGDWTIFGSVPSGLRVGTVTNHREVGLTLRRDF